MKDTARKLIQDALIASFQASPPCPLVWDNQPYNQTPKQAFVRASVEFGKAEPSAVGTDFVRITAILRLVAYLPLDTGTQVATKIADRSDTAFMFKEITAAGPPKITVAGDEGCTGPFPNGQSGQFMAYRLNHALRIERGRVA